MMAAHRFGALLSVVALFLIAQVASGGEEESSAAERAGDLGVTAEPVPGGTAGSDVAQGFSLDLERLVLGAPESFGLFASPPNADGPWRGLLPSGNGELAVTSPNASGLDDLSAALVWHGDRVPDGLSFDFSVRTWDDLDAWEKTGLVMSRASAAAGLGYLLYQLFD